MVFLHYITLRSQAVLKCHSMPVAHSRGIYEPQLSLEPCCFVEVMIGRTFRLLCTAEQNTEQCMCSTEHGRAVANLGLVTKF